MGARSIEYTCGQIDSHNNDKLNSYNRFYTENNSRQLVGAAKQ